MDIRPTPTDEEAAAIAAVVAIVTQPVAVAAPDAGVLHLWADASRRSAQRAGLQRGPWRLSGRLPRRSRA